MTTDQFGLGAENYLPDPDRDTTAIIEGFFEGIAATIREHGLPDALLPEIRKRHEELCAAQAHRIVDEPARYNLRMTLALVAAHQYLLLRLGRDASRAAIRRAFVEPLGAPVRDATRMMLDTAEDPFTAMVGVSKTREEHAFGAGFTFERPADTSNRYHLDIVRCFYHDVLVTNSAADLTPVMCEFDTNWIAAINPERHGFRFDRATTIGLGGTHCPFHFDRTQASE